MDLWVLNLKSGVGGGGVGGACCVAAAAGRSKWGRKRVAVLQQSTSWRGASGVDGLGVFGGRGVEIGVSASGGTERGHFGCRPLEVRATGKKGHDGSPSQGSNDSSIPEEDGSGGSNSISGETKSEESLNQKSPHLNLDWRTFRANLVVQYNKGQAKDSDTPSEETVSEKPSSGPGSKWAHPIAVPETGCVLIATDKLDGVRNFERTVVLLFRIGTRDHTKGPLGVILNRPLHKKIKQMKPSNPDLATTFADCPLHSGGPLDTSIFLVGTKDSSPLHFGGPLDASIFLVRTKESSPTPIFEQVVPGVCVGAWNSLDVAASLVKKGVCHPKDFRFFVGYAGWDLDQLREEIESGFWIVAACSPDLIGSAALDSSSGLWEEILQLMGGRYSDLSRKAKGDDKS